MRKKRPEKPAILVAWHVQRHRFEDEIKMIKYALRHPQPLSVLRKLRRRLRVLRYQLQALYELRVMGKRLSYARWKAREEASDGEQMELIEQRRMQMEKEVAK